jgi:hypothetical protein
MEHLKSVMPEIRLEPMAQAMDNLENEITALTGLVDTLERRLDPVLKPELLIPTGPGSDLPKSPVPPPNAPATQYINTQRLRVETLGKRFRNMLDRCEV